MTYSWSPDIKYHYHTSSRKVSYVTMGNNRHIKKDNNALMSSSGAFGPSRAPFFFFFFIATNSKVKQKIAI